MYRANRQQITAKSDSCQNALLYCYQLLLASAKGTQIPIHQAEASNKQPKLLSQFDNSFHFLSSLSLKPTALDARRNCCHLPLGALRLAIN